MYNYSNPHPLKKSVGDCVKRAIVHATGMGYKEVSLELNRHKKESGARVYNQDLNWESYVEKNYRAIKMSFPASKGVPRMNGHRFTEAYPKGNYVLRMANHLVACVDGVILDTWDCREKCVYSAYEVRERK